MTGRAAGARPACAALGGALLLVLAVTAAATTAARPPRPTAPSTAGPSPAATADGAGGTVAARVAVSPITLALELRQAVARADRPVRATATVTNHSSRQLRSIVVSIDADPLLDVRPAASRSIRSVAAGAGGSVSWTICGRQPGTFAVVATATVDGSTVRSSPQWLTVPPGGSC